MTHTRSDGGNGGLSLTLWLLWHGLRRAPKRLLLEGAGMAFPVAMMAGTLLFVDAAVQSMTPVALAPVQIEMRAVAKSINVDIAAVSDRLATAPGVSFVEPFAAASVIVAPGTSGQVTARLFAVRPEYLQRHGFVKVMAGDLGQGALLSQSMRNAPGFLDATSITISLPGDAPDLNLTLPVGGTVDLRAAATWFSVPYGEAQGDIVTVPRAIVIDYDTYLNKILPVLKTWAERGGLPPFDPGAAELPRSTLEAHVTVDHAAYPPDPGAAEIWTGKLQKALGLLAGAPVIVADNAAEALMESRQDATNAKILFLLLGIPGVLVAAILGLTCAAMMVEATRRETALLRMRGATPGQIVGLSLAHVGAAGVVGAMIGILCAGLLVSAATGRWVWQGVPAGDLGWSVVLALLAGALTSTVQIIGLRKSARQDEVAQRRLLNSGWMPMWRKAWLDGVLIAVGAAILGVNFYFGGLRPGPIAGPALALSFYVLLAPVMIWLGATLLVIRGLVALLAGWSRPDRTRPLGSWFGATLRWFARRPAQTGRALAVSALAVAFSAEVLSFAATYQTAKQVDLAAAIGSDLMLTPGDPHFKLPDHLPAIMAFSPIRIVPARVDSDRKSILAIDLATFRETVTALPRMLSGTGLDDLAKTPDGVLINSEIAKDYELKVGDKLPLTSFPDDFENAAELEPTIVGIYSSFPPTFPLAEVVALVDALPRANTVPPDFYLARVAPDQAPAAVAAALTSGPLGQTFVVSDRVPVVQRGLTTLNLAGLSLIEAIGSTLIAVVGSALLGAFLILERRREFAVLQTIGANLSQLLTGSILEGCVVVAGSLLIGLPVGLGLGMLDVRVLSLFFALEPPLLTLPAAGLALLALSVALGSAVALGLALSTVTRLSAAAVLREA